MWHGIVLGGRVAGLISKTADAQGSIEFTQNAEEKNKNIQWAEKQQWFKDSPPVKWLLEEVRGSCPSMEAPLSLTLNSVKSVARILQGELYFSTVSNGTYTFAILQTLVNRVFCVFRNHCCVFNRFVYQPSLILYQTTLVQMTIQSNHVNKVFWNHSCVFNRFAYEPSLVQMTVQSHCVIHFGQSFIQVLLSLMSLYSSYCLFSFVHWYFKMVFWDGFSEVSVVAFLSCTWKGMGLKLSVVKELLLWPWARL